MLKRALALPGLASLYACLAPASRLMADAAPAPAVPAAAIAAPAASAINSGDTAFVLISAALVLLMTPGLALFYGGMVRRKNVLATIMQSFLIMAMVSIIWVTIGYSLAFGPTQGGWIGSLAWMGLHGVGGAPNPDYAATIPALVFMAFQMKFAIITPALICGAYAERMKFKYFLVFSALWAILIYCPVAHWVWGVGGFIRNWGALDFAGGRGSRLLAAFQNPDPFQGGKLGANLADLGKVVVGDGVEKFMQKAGIVIEIHHQRLKSPQICSSCARPLQPSFNYFIISARFF